MKNLNDLQNYRNINVRYISPTNHKGARICIEEKKRYNDDKTKRKYFPYCYKTGNVQKQGFNVLVKGGFNVVCYTSTYDNYIFIVNNWGENFIKVSDLKS
jgi:hypothetical protein